MERVWKDDACVATAAECARVKWHPARTLPRKKIRQRPSVPKIKFARRSYNMENMKHVDHILGGKSMQCS